MKPFVVTVTAGALVVGAALGAPASAQESATSSEDHVRSTLDRIVGEVALPESPEAPPMPEMPESIKELDPHVPVVGAIPTSTPVPDLSETIRDGLTGELDTADIGPHIKCELIAPLPWPLPDYETECPPQEAGTTTPPDQPGGGGNGGGGDGGQGGGGDASEPQGGGGGGGGNGGGGGGGGDDGRGGGGAEDGVGGGGDVPGIPQTGVGGDPTTLATLIGSFMTMLVCGLYWYALARRSPSLDYFSA